MVSKTDDVLFAPPESLEYRLHKIQQRRKEKRKSHHLLDLFEAPSDGALISFKNLEDLYLFQTTAGTTKANAVTNPIGLALDQSGNGNNATQATTTARPLYAATGAVFDAVDDSMTVTYGSSQGSDCTVINSLNGVGYQMNTNRTVGTTLSVNRDCSKLLTFNRSLTSPELDLVERYIGTERKYMILKSSDTTIANMRIYSGGAATDLLFIGANGATVTKSLSLDINTSYDVSADGLTAPVLVVFPDSLRTSTTLQRLSFHSNNLSGSIPDLSANTAMTSFSCYTNQLTGSIPSLSANTALITFSCRENQLTGSIPSLSANTAMTVFSCYSNQLTGSIPSLSANTAMTVFYCYSNQLTGYAGGGVSITLGDFRAENNLLTQAAVDLILSDFVAANKTTGTRILNIGGTGNAAPSAAGLLDKATLVSRGWTVTTN